MYPSHPPVCPINQPYPDQGPILDSARPKDRRPIYFGHSNSFCKANPIRFPDRLKRRSFHRQKGERNARENAFAHALINTCPDDTRNTTDCLPTATAALTLTPLLGQVKNSWAKIDLKISGTMHPHCRIRPSSPHSFLDLHQRLSASRP